MPVAQRLRIIRSLEAATNTRTECYSGSPARWKAVSGQFPVISGGAQITGWTKGSGSIWSAPAPSTLDTRQLYINGMRAQRATGPLPVSVSQTSTGYTTSSGDPMANWRNPSAMLSITATAIRIRRFGITQVGVLY